jgi:hypothetical protein
MKEIKKEPGKIILVAMLSLSLAIVGFGKNLTINKIGEAGQRIYSNVFVNGNYAYCAAWGDGVDIFSIIDPTHPVKVANIATPGGAGDIAVIGNYAYIAEYDGMGMVDMQVVDITDMNTPLWVGHCFSIIGSSQPLFIRVVDNYAYLASSFPIHDGWMAIIDISIPSTPFVVGQYHVNNAIEDLVIDGHYAYLPTVDIDSYLGFLEAYLHIIDITNPASPILIGHYAGIGEFKDLQISGKYLYIAGHDYEDPYNSYSDYYYYLLILDVSRGISPKKVGKIRLSSRVDTIGLRPDNKYAYLTSGSFDSGMYVVDISRPSSPVEVNKIAGICAEEIVIKDGYIYGVNRAEGLKIYDISNAVTPTLSWKTAASSLDCAYLAAVRGDYAYVFACLDNMYIYDISDPTHPVEKRIHHIGGYTRDIKLSGNYAYLVLGYSGLMVMDISKPTNPVVVGNYPVSNAWGVYVNGNYAYIAGGEGGFYIIDISNPASPIQVGNWSWVNGNNYTCGVYVRDNYAYLADSNHGLIVLDIGNPANPTLLYSDSNLRVHHVFIKDDYLYIDKYFEGFNIYNVSDPANPRLVKTISLTLTGDLVINQDKAFAPSRSDITVYDISNPSSAADFPVIGKFHNKKNIDSICVVNNLIYAAGERFTILEFSAAPALPRISLDRTSLNFTCYAGQNVVSQSFAITNLGGGNLDWSLSSSQEWLQFTPVSGNAAQKVFTSVCSESLAAGTYHGKIIVSSALADNSPLEVTVTLTVKPRKPEPGMELPFGAIDTPTYGAVVSSSIPVSGWALDDTGVESVQLYSSVGNSMVFISEAVFVEGARPDVANAFPGYPNNTKAGWGYMLLTNLLPEGDGQYTIYAIAVDYDGNQTTLGSKTITVDNAHAVKPFGTIDTPTQGGMAQGSQYVNFGWALTPSPKTIPIDGSTITVWVDGVPLGHPVYNLYRSDIAQLFPGYNNSAGAGGYFYLDTTKYENGLHTIQWTVTDDFGYCDGIGSRYFTIHNNEHIGAQFSTNSESDIPVVLSVAKEKIPTPPRQEDDQDLPIDVNEPVWVKIGYALDTGASAVYPDPVGTVEITISEVERVEIRFDRPVEALGRLPIGSSLDRERGIFYWQPGAGVLSTHLLVFKTIDSNGKQWKKRFSITLKPMF